MTRLRSSIVLSLMILATAVCSGAAVFISVQFGPPPLPVHAQPLCPGAGYIWVPGYWAWSPDWDQYYWVPATWVLAPQSGFLWTPGYWGFSAGLYFWHPGYWGPVVGFYGGINYGFGYPGYGYYGGYWHGRDFYYNRAVNNINITNVHYVYNQPITNNLNVSRVAYNGGPGGIQAQPTAAQIAAERERHTTATSTQVQHEQAARKNPAQFVSRSQGRPAVVATPRPGALNAREATRANLPAMNRPAPTLNANANVGRPTPRPPQNNQQARAPQHAPRPGNNTRPALPSPQVNETPRPGPNTGANNQSAPQPAPQEHNLPRPETAQHATPESHPESQQQARHTSHPPQPAPQQHAVTRPAPNMTPLPPQLRQAEPPRQSAAHQAPAPRGREEEPPR